MTSFKSYFKLHFKANIRALIYILAAVTVFTFLLALDGQPTAYYDFELNRSIPGYKSTLYIPIIFPSVLSYVLPVLEFSFFKKRINLDCAYSLPISRRAMGTVHYLTGLITLFGAFTVSYLVNLALLLSRGEGWFNFAPMIAHYLLCLLLGFSMYSLMVFVFNEANTKGDGIWFMILYSFVMVLVVSALSKILDDNYLFGDAYSAIPWQFTNTLTSCYEDLVEIHASHKTDFWQTSEYVGWFIFWVAVGIASAVGFFLTFGKRRMEKTEEISNSYFGYRVLIPIYAAGGMISFRTSQIFTFWVIIELFALLGYTIYRRGFHYKKSDIIVLLSLMVFLFV